MAGSKEALNAIRAFQERIQTQDSAMFRAVEQALQVIRGAFHVYKPQELCFSFNGGKDSTVLLHLLRAVAAERPHTDMEFHQMQHVYFHNDGEFPEVLDFLKEESNKYSMNLSHLGQFQDGIQQLVDEKGIRAIFIGTRYSDPNAGDQDYFTPTTTDWPPVMRINPIIRWSYQEVWSFLIGCGFDYCKLYDHGYTSLGSIHDCFPNPYLKTENGSEAYQPAWKLQSAVLERAGRDGEQTRDYGFGEGLNSSLGEGFSRNHTDSPKETPTAALAIIGDEVLNGSVEDVNSPHAIRKFTDNGVDVKRAVTIEDSVGEIAAEVQNSAAAHDIVVTAGGIGPTHDDVTMRALASAFNRKIERNGIMEAFLRGYSYYRTGVEDANPQSLPLADLPEGVNLLFPGATSEEDEALLRRLPRIWEEDPTKCSELCNQYGFPILLLENVFILPGVPSLFAKKIDQIVDRFRSSLFQFPKVEASEIFVEASESSIARILEACQKNHHRVKIGSYPVDNDFFGEGKAAPQVRITVTGRDAHKINEAREAIHGKLLELQKSSKACKILSWTAPKG
eukprot:gb/GECG01014515.1/.p1 GENE.gb/GECG01014515.1/~~gb/GECG01014515.1/.p1  ORF type:complete len:563 (+),score=65.13 gb/GECG01014515.1/:1-1689(+)